MALPSLTPILGGYLTQHFNWEANFIFLLLLAACLLLVLVFFAHETIETINPNAIKPRQMAKDYIFIASNIKFLCYLAMMISGASCLLLFQVTGAFVA
ncbi:hypothetical protein [Vibrio thalassae]|uniref:hypothetical protein n=1 Tax=Vibrio thalassae TaxID=1243014 RepID=UPI00278BD058|nr:hypothetical protein [Vibrio thalassae]